MDYHKLSTYLENNDRFIRNMGVRIQTIREGYACLVLNADEAFFNANGAVNGGALYTLADFAGVCAASSYGWRITTVNGSINYLNAVLRPGPVCATARVIKAGHKIIDIDVQVTDAENRLCLQCALTFYNLGARLAF